ncbi:MAG: hypothetical protein LBP29_06755 [Treponema sp.]|jgi:hypothetical protein|nr:hypothetical protein [Treponema sp.]
MIKKILFCAAFCLAAVLCLGGMELTVLGGLGNASFDTKSTSPMGNGEFEGTLYPFVRMRLDETVSDSVEFSGTMERDPILKNRLGAEAKISAGLFAVSAGPVLGLFNSGESVIRPGVQAGITFELPGIVFAALNAGSTFGSPESEGDYEARHGRLELGFWLPNIVNTLSISEKNYDSREKENLDVRNKILRYHYSADVYAKNVPYRVVLNLGYQTLTRSIVNRAAFTVEEDVYNIIFLGAETSFNVRPNLRLIFGGETPVYSWGKKPLTKKDKLILFEAYAGFTYTIERRSPQ